LETARLIIRDIRDDDAACLVRALDNLNVTRNTSSIPYPYTHADALHFIARQKSKPSRSIKKVIALKPTPHQMLGSVRLHIDSATNSCELGFWVAEPHWGKGYATEAAAFMVAHAFQHLDHSIIQADFNTDNPESGRVLQRIGFREIGMGEDFSVAQGKWVPVILVQLTKQQWQSFKSERMEHKT
jgi:RimJ/RimL family protein N-acetyltransferase